MIIIRVRDHVQPFYRSSGRNSGRPRTWFPFDGLTWGGIWIHKARFCNFDDLHHPLMRYGTVELKSVSDWLATQDIPRGEVTEDWIAINAWLEAAGAVICPLVPSTHRGGSNTYPQDLPRTSVHT